MSIILSLDYEIEGEYRGKSKEELLEIAEAIKGGQSYLFDLAEVNEVIEYAKHVSSIPASKLVVELLRWTGPVILILGVVYATLWLAK